MFFSIKITFIFDWSNIKMHQDASINRWISQFSHDFPMKTADVHGFSHQNPPKIHEFPNFPMAFPSKIPLCWATNRRIFLPRHRGPVRGQDVLNGLHGGKAPGAEEPGSLAMKKGEPFEMVEPLNIYTYMAMDQYLLISIFRGMNIHLPTILMFTRGTRFWDN